MRAVYILGAGGFAKEVAWVIKEEFRQVFYLSDDPKQHGLSLCYGVVVSSLDDLPFTSLSKDRFYICGVGSPELKRKFVARVCLYTKKPRWFGPVIHSTVAIGAASVGEGTVICANSSLTCDIDIGKHVAINLNCTVGHDVVIKDFCNLSPGVHISGHAVLEEGVDIGTGAVILPRVRVGRDAVIGAGAVVTKDVPARAVAVGVPAKVIKVREE